MLFKDSMQDALPAAQAHLEAIYGALSKMIDAHSETEPPGIADWFEVRQELARVTTRSMLALDAVMAAGREAENDQNNR